MAVCTRLLCVITAAVGTCADNCSRGAGPQRATARDTAGVKGRGTASNAAVVVAAAQLEYSTGGGKLGIAVGFQSGTALEHSRGPASSSPTFTSYAADLFSMR